MGGVGSGVGVIVSFAWRTTLVALRTNEMVVGSVWGPGVLEWLEYRASGIDLVLRAWAVPGRVSNRVDIVTAEVVNAAPLIEEFSATALPENFKGTLTAVTGPVLIPLGRVVPWSAWSILLQVENTGAAGRDVSGTFVVRVLREEQVAPAAFVERVMVRHLARSLSRGVS